MHPAVQYLLIALFILVPVLNVKYLIIFITIFAIIIPYTQGLVIFGLNFYIFRLLLIAGWIKIAFNKDLRLKGMAKTDKAIIYWILIGSMIYIIREQNFLAVINRLGFAYNVIGVYFLYRIIIKTNDDIRLLFNTLIFTLVIVSIFMLNEQVTGKNLFSVFGMHEYTSIRMGRLRSQGPFAHSINAGMFGAIMFPLCFSMWRHKWGSVFLGMIGTLAACTLVIASASMTPLVACIAGFIALLFWPLRNNMRTVKFFIFYAAAIFQIIIMSPLWSLIKKLDFIKGASTSHRFALIDNLANRFNEWFLIGYSTPENWGRGMQDRANQFYSEALTGGLIKLVLFVVIIVLTFNIIGNRIKNSTDLRFQKKLWALGSALFANVVGFLGISLWDQMTFVWYLLLALITSTCLIIGEKSIKIDEMSIKMEKAKELRSTGDITAGNA